MTQKPDAVELKPCPFCGGPGYLCQIPSASGGERFIWIAKCSAEEGCGVEFLGCSRKVDAIKEWNTRDTAELDALRREVEAGKALADIAQDVCDVFNPFNEREELAQRKLYTAIATLTANDRIAELEEMLCVRCGFNVEIVDFEGEGKRAICRRCDDRILALEAEVAAVRSIANTAISYAMPMLIQMHGMSQRFDEETQRHLLDTVMQIRRSRRDLLALTTTESVKDTDLTTNIESATESWKGVDTDEFIKEMRNEQ